MPLDLPPPASDGLGFLLAAERIAVNHAVDDRIERAIIGARSRLDATIGGLARWQLRFKRPFAIAVTATKTDEPAVARGCDLIFPTVGILLAFEGQAGAHRDAFAPHAPDPGLASAQLLLEDITQRSACVDA